MKQTIRARMLGIYDLFLATGAIWIGAQMVLSSSGTIFAEEYPDSGHPGSLLIVGLCLGFSQSSYLDWVIL
ncbi:hypothetical protein V1499_09730 [Neobacillus sp. SCS-31]|uniref:hypothetical protein n=1 Tax=Neobacillus oceani TaxID=3115292 RepID=UPI0039059E40